MYTKQQKEDIENILKMFNDYVQNHMTVDVLWSDKAGYLFGYLDWGLSLESWLSRNLIQS